MARVAAMVNALSAVVARARDQLQEQRRPQRQGQHDGQPGDVHRDTSTMVATTNTPAAAIMYDA